MQIPGGDLAPARRRRYGGSYGRRRRRRSLLVAAVVLALAAGVVYLVTRPHTPPVPLVAATHRPCATSTPTPAPLPSPQQVRLALLNGTSRNGLAKAVAAQLTARGFVVTGADTAPAALHGPTQIGWGPGAERSAALLAEHLGPSVLVGEPRLAAGTVQVTLGSQFRGLVTPPSPAQVTPAPTGSAPAPGC